jgi:hypothetical protein
VKTVINTLAANFTMPGPGALGLGLSPSNGQKLGSVLIYPFYTSSVNSARQNARFTLTNTDPLRETSVHLFFVDGSDCSVADRFVTLTANQTTSFLASDLDPMISGYMIAVAVNENGCPRFFNHLIGEVLVKTETGTRGQPAGDRGQRPCWRRQSADVQYVERHGRAAARRHLLQRAAADPRAEQSGITGGREQRDAGDQPDWGKPGGNRGRAPRAASFGMLYDDVERGASFTMSGSSCQLRSDALGQCAAHGAAGGYADSGGRIGLDEDLKRRRRGIVGAYFNQNPVGFTQGHVLHGLTTTRSVVITIPVVRPDSNRPEAKSTVDERRPPLE